MRTFDTVGAAPVISIVASSELIAALDLAASKLGTTRSHYARTLLARNLRDTGHLAAEAPVTNHDARRQAGR